MDKKVKQTDLKDLGNIDLYKNDYVTVSNINIKHKNQNKSITFIREPYTNDTVGAVLLYKKTADGKIKIIFQKRIIPYLGNKTQEHDMVLFAPCTKKDIPIKEAAIKAIEDKTGYVLESSNLIYKGEYYIYPKLATKMHLFLYDISKATKDHDPTVQLEEMLLDDDKFRPTEPFLAILINALKEDLADEDKEITLLDIFQEKYETKINILIDTIIALGASSTVVLLTHLLLGLI